MTELLEQAIEKVRALPPEVQDEIARMVLAWVNPDDELVNRRAKLTPDRRAILTPLRAAA